MAYLNNSKNISPVEFLSKSSAKKSNKSKKSKKSSESKKSEKKSKKSKRRFFRGRKGRANLSARINALKSKQIELKNIRREQENAYYRAYRGSKEYYRQQADTNSRALYNIIFKMYNYFHELLNVCSKEASKINTQVKEMMFNKKINENWWKFRQMFITLRDTIEKCINDKTIRKYIKKNKLEKTNDKNLKALINKKFVEFVREADELIRDGDYNMHHYKYGTPKSTSTGFYSTRSN